MEKAIELFMSRMDALINSSDPVIINILNTVEEDEELISAIDKWKSIEDYCTLYVYLIDEVEQGEWVLNQVGIKLSNSIDKSYGNIHSYFTMEGMGEKVWGMMDDEPYIVSIKVKKKKTKTTIKMKGIVLLSLLLWFLNPLTTLGQESKEDKWFLSVQDRGSVGVFKSELNKGRLKLSIFNALDTRIDSMELKFQGGSVKIDQKSFPYGPILISNACDCTGELISLTIWRGKKKEVFKKEKLNLITYKR